MSNNITSKDKIEMLEKEANLLLKQLIIYLSILGSIILFLVQNFNIKVSLKEIYSHFELILPLWLIVSLLIGNILHWIDNTLTRLKYIREHIKEINNKGAIWN